MWAVVIDVSDLDRGASFWGGLLGLAETARRHPYVYMSELASGVQLVLQETRDEKISKNRVHLELTGDPDATVAWVIDHGGRIVDEPSSEHYILTVMADPDGNELCISRRRSPDAGGSLP